jgi:signal transduction histidine kinase
MNWPYRLAIAASLLTGALLVAGVALAVLAPRPGALAHLGVALAVAPTSAVLGGLVTRRGPGNIVGLLLTVVGFTVAFTSVKEVAWQVLAGRPATLTTLDWLVAWLHESAWWAFVAVALLLLYFPDGRLPSRRWRSVPPLLLAGALLRQVYGAFATEPFRPPLQHLARPFGPLPGWLDVLGFVAFVLTLVLLVACAGSLVVRFRRGDRLRRSQIKWLALAGIGVPLYPPLCLVEIAIWGRPGWFSLAVVIAAVVGIPVATAIAILRHDLYDVDKALAGTVTWGLISVVLLGIYGISSVAAGLVLGRGSPAAAAGATALCALALSPLRMRLQRAVDGRLYPLRRGAMVAIETLHRDTSARRARPDELQQVLRVAMRDPALRVGFQIPGTEGFVDTEGVAVDPTGGVPVVLDGAQIGVLVPGDGIASPDLLRQVAGACAVLVEVVRLRLELRRALHEVEASRARLVQIGFEERRRLERDLHDGAQQRLVSLGMAIRLAQRHLGDGTVDVDALLDQSVAELGTAVAELRQIAHGLRPTSLDDGLHAAVSTLVRTVPVAVDMDVCADVLPDDVATTAYYVLSEAVTNAVKHSDAECIRLHVVRVDGQLIVRVSDDGRGGAVLRATSGLADRVAALGGMLQVDSPPGGGTVVEAALPCAS